MNLRLVPGGSAVVTTGQPSQQVVNVAPADGLSRSWTLDVTVLGSLGLQTVRTGTDGVWIGVSMGAGQTAVRQRYRVSLGRSVLSVSGASITVDVAPDGVLSQPLTVLVALAEAPTGQAALAAGGYTEFTVSARAAGTVLEGSQAFRRNLYNAGANLVTIQTTNARVFATLAVGATLTMPSCPGFLAFAPAPTDVHVVDITL